MARKLNNNSFWSVFSMISILKVSIIGFAIITTVALIVNKSAQIL